MRKIVNPFNTAGYISEKYFCDRITELNRLLQNARNGVNTTLISGRKYGKSALIYRFFEELNKEKEWICIYFDIYSTQNLKEFTEQLAAKVMQKFPQKESMGKRFWNYLKTLRPVMTYDALSGQPEVHFEFSQPKDYEKTLTSILQFLDEQKTPVLLAIDEFQQVALYPEKNTEAVLRTIIQTLHNVQFIFSGSNQHLMLEIFSSAKRPFFSSTQSMSLSEIPPDVYTDFIFRHFTENKKEITNETVEFILDWTFNHTYYTQFLCNNLFASGSRKPDIPLTKSVCAEILEAEQANFLQYRNLLTSFQWRLLIAIAKEEKLFQPQSKQFIQKYKLGAASTVKKAIDSLIDKEMVFVHIEKDESYYRIYDVFLMRWLQRTY
ncbi:MAG: ATP-binding protein [Paludibacter sp.]